MNKQKPEPQPQSVQPPIKRLLTLLDEFAEKENAPAQEGKARVKRVSEVDGNARRN